MKDLTEPVHHAPPRRRVRPRWTIVVALLAVMALVAGACGSDRDDEADEGTETTLETGGEGGGESEEGMFGDLESPCGEGDASGATDQGVTDTSITIGFGDDAGFPSSPGLNQEVSDGVRAAIQWCNEQGGINGREVVGEYYDAKITEVNNVMTEACGTVFMMVGQGFSLDSAQEQTRLGCELASVPAWSVSPQFANGPLMVQPVPNPVDFTPVQTAAAMQEAFPEEITKTAVMYANYAATIDTKDKVLESYPPFGFEFLDCPQEYAITGEANWAPFIQSLSECGAEVVYFTGSPFPNFVNVLDAAAQAGFDPIWITDANFYDASFAAWNTNGYGDKVYVRQTFTPLEEAEDSPATQLYLDIVEAEGGKANQLGAQATSAFLLWATAAQACGSDLTRDCVMAELANVTEWTGGGLHAPTKPAENLPPECGLTLKLNGTSFERFQPTEAGEFDCDPEFVQEVTGPVVQRANLDADRIAQPG
jgi:ABC-type branched-subunit amino acid transport system substrate-binding protein